MPQTKLDHGMACYRALKRGRKYISLLGGVSKLPGIGVVSARRRIDSRQEELHIGRGAIGRTLRKSISSQVRQYFPILLLEVNIKRVERRANGKP